MTQMLRPSRRLSRYSAPVRMAVLPRRRTAALALHPPTFRQVAVRPTITARALGILLLTIASGLQKRMKTGIEAIPLIDRLKASLEGLPQLLSSRLHGARFPPHLHTGLGRVQDLNDILREDHLFCADHRGVVR